MDDNIVVVGLTAIGGFVAWVVRQLLLEYRDAIDRNTDALTNLILEIRVSHSKKE